eukprot:COSAG01_NODE_1688_length_9488_cov_35.125466_4_plen_746_part_00
MRLVHPELQALRSRDLQAQARVAKQQQQEAARWTAECAAQLKAAQAQATAAVDVEGWSRAADSFRACLEQQPSSAACALEIARCHGHLSQLGHTPEAKERNAAQTLEWLSLAVQWGGAELDDTASPTAQLATDDAFLQVCHTPEFVSLRRALRRQRHRRRPRRRRRGRTARTRRKRRLQWLREAALEVVSCCAESAVEHVELCTWMRSVVVRELWQGAVSRVIDTQMQRDNDAAARMNEDISVEHDILRELEAASSARTLDDIMQSDWMLMDGGEECTAASPESVATPTSDSPSLTASDDLSQPEPEPEPELKPQAPLTLIDVRTELKSQFGLSLADAQDLVQFLVQLAETAYHPDEFASAVQAEGGGIEAAYCRTIFPALQAAVQARRASAAEARGRAAAQRAVASAQTSPPPPPPPQQQHRHRRAPPSQLAPVLEEPSPPANTGTATPGCDTLSESAPLPATATAPRPAALALQLRRELQSRLQLTIGGAQQLLTRLSMLAQTAATADAFAEAARALPPPPPPPPQAGTPTVWPTRVDAEGYRSMYPLLLANAQQPLSIMDGFVPAQAAPARGPLPSSGASDAAPLPAAALPGPAPRQSQQRPAGLLSMRMLADAFAMRGSNVRAPPTHRGLGSGQHNLSAPAHVLGNGRWRAVAKLQESHQLPFDAARWITSDVTRWLRELGLSQYAAAFLREGVDGSALLQLSGEFLRGRLGVAVLGHRKLLLKTIGVLQMQRMLDASTLS